MYKRMIALALSLMMALLAPVCLAENAAGEGAFPVTVTDAAGREVTIDEAPQKLVSGYYITTSMLIAWGLRTGWWASRQGGQPPHLCARGAGAAGAAQRGHGQGV